MPPKAKSRRRRDSDEAFQPSTESDEDSEGSNSGASSTGRGSSGKARSKSPSGSPSGRKDKRSKQAARKGSHHVSRRQGATSTAAEGSSSILSKPKIVIRNPTKRIVTMRRNKKDAQQQQSADPSLLQPPKPGKKKSSKTAKSAASNGEGDDNNGEEVEDELKELVRMPLPSSSRRHVFNKSISVIGAINIQAFGTKKSSNPVLMRIITDILRRYDIVLCQEVRSPAGSEEIVRHLTETVSTPSTPYGYIASRPIGRGRYQERYVFLYRKKEWRVVQDYVIDDDEGLGDKFMREPYVARFQHLRKPNVRVTLVGCHTQPENAFDEVKALVEDVYGMVKKEIQRSDRNEQSFRMKERGIEDGDDNVPLWRQILCCCFPSISKGKTREAPVRPSIEDEAGLLSEKTEPIVMMGDFNAAGSYVNKGQRAELDALLQQHGLYWGIQNTTDTTVADGENTAYDRFVFEKEHEKRWIGNTSVWRFDQEWEKIEEDTELVKRLAKKVTDHYPIEFELRL